jgi:hypothetical protein
MPTCSSRGAAPEEDRRGPPRPADRARAAPGCTVVGARPCPPLRRILGRGRGRALARRQSSSLLVPTRRPSGSACARAVGEAEHYSHLCTCSHWGARWRSRPWCPSRRWVSIVENPASTTWCSRRGNQETSNGSSGHRTLHVKGWVHRVERLVFRHFCPLCSVVIYVSFVVSIIIVYLLSTR